MTGVSPKEGYPGTKIVIRGENLGKDERDLIAVRIYDMTILTGLKRNAQAELSHDNPLRISVEESNKMSSEFLAKEFPNCKRFQIISLN